MIIRLAGFFSVLVGRFILLYHWVGRPLFCVSRSLHPRVGGPPSVLLTSRSFHSRVGGSLSVLVGLSILYITGLAGLPFVLLVLVILQRCKASRRRYL